QARKQSPAIADALAAHTCEKVPAGCDAAALEQEARDQEAIGQHGAALAKLEKAIACKPTEHRFQLAMMSACNAGNKAKAKYYYKKSGTSRAALAQMCVRMGISMQDLEAP